MKEFKIVENGVQVKDILVDDKQGIREMYFYDTVEEQNEHIEYMKKHGWTHCKNVKCYQYQDREKRLFSIFVKKL